MRISLNLATRPFTDLGPALKRLRIAMGALVVVAGLLVLGLRTLHQKAEEARARDHSLDGKIAAITQERQGYQDLMHQPANAQLLSQVGVLNQLFDEKTFSWTLAMEDLETVLPGGVQVSTLEPVRDKTGKITLRLRVVGPRDRAVELVHNLEHSKSFLLPRIVGENAEATGGPNERAEPVSASNRVNFDLQADFNPAALGEHKRAARVEEASTPAAHVAPGTQVPPSPLQLRDFNAQQPSPHNPVPHNSGPGAVRPPYQGPAGQRFQPPQPNAGGPQ